jgi:hypothetical protein
MALAMGMWQTARNVPKRDNSAGFRSSDVKRWPTTADPGQWRPCGRNPGQRCAGADGRLGATVAGFDPAAVEAQFDFCHASDRDRRAGAANPQPAAGNACRRANRLPGEPAPGRGRWLSDPANHLDRAVSPPFHPPPKRAKKDQCGGSFGDGGELLSGCRSGEATSGDGAFATSGGGAFTGSGDGALTTSGEGVVTTSGDGA